MEDACASDVVVCKNAGIITHATVALATAARAVSNPFETLG
jgi:3-dehydroquinate dehydratase